MSALTAVHRGHDPHAARVPTAASPPGATAALRRSTGDAGLVDAVDAAFAAQPRERFLPRRQRRRASYDGPLDIGHGQTSSQPRTVAAMLRLLNVQQGQRVLDVGSGSGWTTALLTQLTGPDGSVDGVEIEPDLVDVGRRNLAGAGHDTGHDTGHITGQPGTRIHQARAGVLGLPELAPFDRILVSAEPSRLPQQLVNQLADSGRMVIPVAGTMLLVVRRGEDVEVTEHGAYRFVPLR